MTINVTAPMVGKILSVMAKVGDTVQEDDPIAMMEAMKVEMPISAPEKGVVKSILVSEGDLVEADKVIAILE